VPLAVDLYRNILSEQEDASVVIVTVGPLKNIEDLLKSRPDAYSDLPGKALIERKVKKFAIMGGHFPHGRNEWNLMAICPASPATCCKS
jgi:inosine-uridine nucleoside N-ribohydrolase